MAEERALGAALEALLLMAEEPLRAESLAEATGCPVEDVTVALSELAEFYDRHERGFELRHVAGGWRYATRSEHAEMISAWVLEGTSSRLSQAALETLSVVAYLQPVSRSRVSAVRGVSVDGVIRTLVARGLITEDSTDPHSGATLFVTTDLFCEKLGLASLDDLPELAPHLPEAAALEQELADLAAERQATEAAQAEQAPLPDPDDDKDVAHAGQ